MGVRKYLEEMWKRIEGAISEIVAHFIVSSVAILTITGTEQLLHLAQLDKTPIPLLHISLSEWMLGLDVFSASAILLIGLAKAVRELVR